MYQLSYGWDYKKIHKLKKHWFKHLFLLLHAEENQYIFNMSPEVLSNLNQKYFRIY